MSDTVADNDHQRPEHHEQVLAFHKVMPKISFGVTNYSPPRLRRLLQFISGLGYRFAPTEDASTRYIRITFDDAYEHLLDYLPPLIDEFGLKPIVFVPTAFIGKANTWDYSSSICRVRHLSGPQIKTLADSGVEFGSHGHRHIDLTSLSADTLTEDLRTSKTIIEDITGSEVTCLSYPFGRVNKRVIETAAQLGFTVGYTMTFPKPGDPALTRGRYPVYSYDTPFSVRQKISGGSLRNLEKLKAGLTTRLSGGTILWGRWFGGTGH